jgi:prolyl oligopeptidase
MFNQEITALSSQETITWPTVPVVDTYHGIDVADPYRWLEERESRDTQAFIQYQQGKARNHFEGLPGRDTIRKRVAAMLEVEEVREPKRIGNRYFFLKSVPGKEQPVIAMREQGSERDDILIDPALRDDGQTASVDLLQVSPDGTLLAYRVRNGGEDAAAVEVFNIQDRCVLPDRLPKGKLHGFAFTPDSQGFLYEMRTISGDTPVQLAAFRHQIGTDHSKDLCLFRAGHSPRTRLAMSVSQSAKYAVYYVRRIESNVKVRTHFLQNLDTLEVVELRVPKGLREFKASFWNDRLIGALKYASGQISYVEIDPTLPADCHWKPILVEDAATTQFAVFHRDNIFRSSIRNFASQIQVLDREGRHQGFIPLPSRGAAEMLPPGADDMEVLLRFESFLQPPTIYRYDVNTRHLEKFSQPKISYEPDLFEQTEFWCPSKDGTRIHMFILGRKDLPKDQPVPTILTAYGGFGTNMLPRFSVFVTFLLEQGCRFVLANIRGGSELGHQWHEAAKRRNRQNAFDDFIAAAEWLIHNNLTSPQQLAIFGGSNSGLLVAAVMTQRPDLLKVVLCIAPILDMLRYDRFDRAHKWIDEYGTADDPNDFAVLHSYSPYHNIKPGTPYPAALFVSGDLDTRCNPLHVRKMVARMQAATSSSAPILMDYSSLRGHSPSLPLSIRIDALTDRLAFVCRELGLEVRKDCSAC